MLLYIKNKRVFKNSCKMNGFPYTDIICVNLNHAYGGMEI